MNSADDQQLSAPAAPGDDSSAVDPAGRVRVAVIFGGRSGEHAVSCLSAASVLAHLDPQRFDVRTIGIAPDGSWRSVDAQSLRQVEKGRFPEVADGIGVSLRFDAEAALVPTARPAPPESGGPGPGIPGVSDGGIDVAFPVLHGPLGEDGTIQGLFEMAGIPYVGAGVLASAAGMDKEFTKKLLAAEGLPIGDYAVLHPGERTLSMAERDRLGLPVFVKPARAGSSLGVSRVDDWDDLDDAVHLARRSDAKVLVESAVIGREIECGVLEHPDGRLQASPTAEIHLAGDHQFYDFEAKYVDDAATFDIPAQLDPTVEERIRELAVRAFRAMDGRGLARVDFFVRDADPGAGDADGPADRVVINEINTMPGFTPISMYPRVFAAAGITYPELLSTLIATALTKGGRGTGPG